MTVYDLYNELDARYERELSAPWDNDGLMVTDNGRKDITKVLISLDPTIEAIQYAIDNGFNVLLTHHPLIFKKLYAICPEDCTQDRVIRALKNGLSVMSFHTRLDFAEDGVNDTLARAIGYKRKQTIIIGQDEESAAVIDLGEAVDSEEFALKCKKALNAPFVRVTGKGKIRRVICAAGAGKDFAQFSRTADALLTGECSYNAAQNAAEEGLVVIEAGHYETEFPICAELKKLLDSFGIESEIFGSLTQKVY